MLTCEELSVVIRSAINLGAYMCAGIGLSLLTAMSLCELLLKSVLSEGSCQLMKRSEKMCTRELARRGSRRAQFLSVAHFAARLSCACRWMPATWLRRNLLHLRNHLADFGESSYTGTSIYNQAGGSVVRTEPMLRAWVLLYLPGLFEAPDELSERRESSTPSVTRSAALHH